MPSDWRSGASYFEVMAGSALVPGVVAAIQTFGDRINFHPHLHFLVTEGGGGLTMARPGYKPSCPYPALAKRSGNYPLSPDF